MKVKDSQTTKRPGLGAVRNLRRWRVIPVTWLFVDFSMLFSPNPVDSPLDMQDFSHGYADLFTQALVMIAGRGAV